MVRSIITRRHHFTNGAQLVPGNDGGTPAGAGPAGPDQGIDFFLDFLLDFLGGEL